MHRASIVIRALKSPVGVICLSNGTHREVDNLFWREHILEADKIEYNYCISGIQQNKSIMRNNKATSYRNFILKTVFILAGYLFYLNVHANQLNSVAHNATLIDSQCVLTVREPDILLPSTVIIQGKEYKVTASNEHPFFTHTLLFLDKPVTTTDPVKRFRINPTPHRKGARNQELYSLWLGNKSSDHDELAYNQYKLAQDGHKLDFSIKKEGCNCYIKYGHNTFTVSSDADPITYPMIIDAEHSLLFSMRKTCPGAGYFIKNDKGEYQLIGMKTAIKAEDGLWLTDVAHDRFTNGYMDSAIIQNALRTKSL